MAQKYSLKEKYNVNKKKYIKCVFFVVAIFVCVLTISIFGFNSKSPSANAKTVYEMSLGDKAESQQLYNALYGCISRTPTASDAENLKGIIIKQEDAAAGKWFSDAPFTFTPSIGYLLAGSGNITTNGSTVSCGGKYSNWITSAASLWGYNGGIDLLCDLGVKRANGQTDCRAESQTGNSDFSSINQSSLPYLKSNIILKIGGDLNKQSKPNAIDYLIHKKAFFAGCLGDANKQPFTTGGGDPAYVYTLTIPDASGIESKPIQYYGVKRANEKIEYYVSSDGKNQSDTCKSIVDYLNDPNNIAVYKAAYDQDIKNGITNPDISYSETESTLKDVSKTTCAIDGIGWLVCPVISFMANIAEKAFQFLATSFLETKSNLVSSSDDSATYNAWKVMRNIANVAFVIAFLVIIFSQLSNIGLDNYGIKKLLPRIIIAAILVNVSFIICQIAVDISNILGYSIKSVLDNLGAYVETPGTGTDASTNGWGWAAIMAGLIAGGITLAFAMSVPILVAAIFALVTVCLILLGRTALIVLLVVISPLAFVAYLLPNTEEYFTKWRKAFVALLLVFPIISLVFGASTLAASIINAASKDPLQQVIAMGVAVIPLFIVPSLLKKAIDSVGNIGAKMSGSGDSLGKKAGAGIVGSSLGQHMKRRKDEDLGRVKTGSYNGRNPIRALRSRINGGINRNPHLNQLTRGYGSALELAGQDQDNKDAKLAIDMLGGNDDLATAISMTGGDATAMGVWTNAGGDHLSASSMEQFRRIRNAGVLQKPSSYIGMAQYLSSSGKGSGLAVSRALGNASAAGASATQVDSARQEARAAYVKSGRGDAAAQINAAILASASVDNNGRPNATIASINAAAANAATDPALALMQNEWSRVRAAEVHRDALTRVAQTDNDGNVIRDQDHNALMEDSVGSLSYQNYLQNRNPIREGGPAPGIENTRKALVGYDKMERRAQEAAMPLIIAAARLHRGAAVTDIASAKEAFGIIT